MDVNLFASQIPTSSSAQDAAQSQPASGKASSRSHGRTSFSSVLHTVHQQEDDPQPQKPADAPAKHSDTHSEPREARLENKDRQPPTSQASQLRSSDATADRAQDASCSSSTCSVQVEDELPQDVPTNPSEIRPDSISQGMLPALLHTPATDQTSQQQVATESAETDNSPASPEESGQLAQSLAPPMLVTVPLTDGSAAPLSSNELYPTTEEPPALSSERTAQLTSGSRLPVDQSAPSDDLGQEHIQPAQGATAPVSQPMDEEAPVVALPKNAQTGQQAAPADPASGLQRPTAEPDDAALVSHMAHADVQPARDQWPALPKQDTAFRMESAKEEGAESAAPARSQSWQAFMESDVRSDTPFAQQDNGSHQQEETAVSQSAMPIVDSHADNAARAAAFTVGQSDQASPRPLNSSATLPMAPSQPLAAPHDATEPSIPSLSRSVVFEVAQPDLGRIHVRVAMTNDLVHTHLSSDRSDVGQFLMNGQDRLQAALQASGLDMGQFRVDIDRQSAGRSFQQGPPQEQGRGWHQNQARSEHNHGSDSHDGRHTASRGMLNLVA